MASTHSLFGRLLACMLAAAVSQNVYAMPLIDGPYVPQENLESGPDSAAIIRNSPLEDIRASQPGVAEYEGSIDDEGDVYPPRYLDEIPVESPGMEEVL